MRITTHFGKTSTALAFHCMYIANSLTEIIVRVAYPKEQKEKTVIEESKDNCKCKETNATCLTYDLVPYLNVTAMRYNEYYISVRSPKLI